MIGSPVALTIRRHIERPSAALLAAFRDAPTGFVTDASNGMGSLHHSIKPLEPGMRLCGPAVTAFCAPMDTLACMAALDHVQPGDVIVVATAGNHTAATVGDLWALWARRIGLEGVVCDGLVRDVPGLLASGLPVFARGHCPNAGFPHGPGEVNCGVTCGGVHVNPGDIVVGDRDGVVVVPLAQAEAVARQLDTVRHKEAQAEALVKRGEKLGFWNEAELATRGALRYLD